VVQISECPNESGWMRSKVHLWNSTTVLACLVTWCLSRNCALYMISICGWRLVDIPFINNRVSHCVLLFDATVIINRMYWLIYGMSEFNLLVYGTRMQLYCTFTINLDYYNQLDYPDNSINLVYSNLYCIFYMYMFVHCVSVNGSHPIGLKSHLGL
jgi:hypothetical protein